MRKKIVFIIGIIFVLLIVILGVILMKKNNKNSNINTDNEIKDFNINLIKTVNKNKTDNYLISPYSIELALNLLKEGASGDTLDELEKVIGTRNIADVTVKDKINVANAAFIKNKYKNDIELDFEKNIKTKYNSEILYDEFTTPKVINDWVNKNTNGMIDKVIDQVSPDFSLGLANALAIDVDWDNPFECINTTSQEFTKQDGSKINVEMMHKSLEYKGYKYLENKNATGVIMPYQKYFSLQTDFRSEEDYEKTDNLEFIGILPKNDINSYIDKLTKEELDNLENTAKEANDDFEIKLALPRFKYDYELDNFKQVLKDIGIKLIFDSERADFTKIIKTTHIYVDEAIHKTHIDLNEKGTKAAAVTYFGFKANGMLIEKKSVDITFNKPFIYMIRDKNTKELLFFGVVYEPNKWVDSTCENVN